MCPHDILIFNKLILYHTIIKITLIEFETFERSQNKSSKFVKLGLNSF